ncbi:unnamed protein product [Mytilus edulis]|uniref:C3H1-type domain-containing protein n=1 Tax=Mytilus edulis TaxID=6550 RepID=A0A8S3QTN4_MYTED|nr:unnamed protein product [Mytilus edulis]
MVELSDIDRVKKWAASKKVNEHSAAELIRLGYDSIEALSCLLPEDLTKSKIPIGQQRLLLRAVKSTFPAESGSESNMAANEQLPATSPAAQLNACATETIDGGAVQTGSGDIYVQAITKQLQQQQSLPLGDGLNKHQGQSTVHPEGTQDFDCVSNIISWKDPQIFLKSSFNDVTINFYDITDFVNVHMSGTSEEKLISDASGGQLIFKSGPVKPKLESLSLCQWSSANLSIMYKLLSSGDLPQTQLLDYLSYTARIYNLVASCDMVSVFFYDREYRQLQKQHKFRWGTDVPHLHSIYLRPKGFIKPQTGGSKYQSTGPRPGVKHDISYASHTSGGREICKRFNSRKGCFMTNCRFEHVCAVPGCANKHPAHSHSNSLHGNPKNGV